MLGAFADKPPNIAIHLVAKHNMLGMIGSDDQAWLPSPAGDRASATRPWDVRDRKAVSGDYNVGYPYRAVPGLTLLHDRVERAEPWRVGNETLDKRYWLASATVATRCPNQWAPRCRRHRCSSK